MNVLSVPTVHGSFFKVNKFGGIPYFLSLSDPYYPYFPSLIAKSG